MGDIYPIFDNKPHPITSPYGWRVHPITKARSFHDGIDFSTVEGTPQKPLMGGIVRAAAADKYGGLFIQIKRDDGLGEWFLHCSKLLKSKGQRVEAGEVISLSGNTGQSTAAHTHYGMQSNADVWASAIDPLPYLLGNSGMNKGDKVEWTKDTNIRQGNGLSYPINATASQGAVAVLRSSEVRKTDGYEWMDVEHPSVTGWAVTANMKLTDRAMTNVDGSPIVTPPVETCEDKIKAAVESTAASYQKIIDSKDALIKEQKATITQLEAEKNEAEKSLAVTQNELRLCQERNDKLEGDIKDLVKLGTEMDERIDSLEKRNAVLVKENQDLRDELEGCEERPPGCLWVFAGLANKLSKGNNGDTLSLVMEEKGAKGAKVGENNDLSI